MLTIPNTWMYLHSVTLFTLLPPTDKSHKYNSCRGALPLQCKHVSSCNGMLLWYIWYNAWLFWAWTAIWLSSLPVNSQTWTWIWAEHSLRDQWRPVRWQGQFRDDLRLLWPRLQPIRAWQRLGWGWAGKTRSRRGAKGGSLITSMQSQRCALRSVNLALKLLLVQ